MLLVYVVLPTAGLLVLYAIGLDDIEPELVFSAGMILFNKAVGVALALACSALFYKPLN